jgi:small subunit ribosomal protein S4
MHGPKGTRGNASTFGRQLREKQKVKRMYGVTEKVFRNYVTKAFKTKGNSADALFGLLEGRLDNVLYRLGFAESRPQARQLVSHRHVFVNGKRVNIPSYQVSVTDTITLSSKAMNMAPVKALFAIETPTIPAWLAREAAAGQISRIPTRGDVPEPISDQDIIEYYSR